MGEPKYPIRTPRLLLRPLEAGDAEAMYAYKSRADVCRYLPHAPLTREQVSERIADLYSLRWFVHEGQSLTLGVFDQTGATLLGDVILFWRSKEHRGGELGYVFAPESVGHGYATEAARAMLRLGFEGLGLHRIIARLDARNDRSRRVLERLGLRPEAHFVRNELFKGEWTDELVYAMLADEWRAQAN